MCTYGQHRAVLPCFEQPDTMFTAQRTLNICFNHLRVNFRGMKVCSIKKTHYRPRFSGNGIFDFRVRLERLQLLGRGRSGNTTPYYAINVILLTKRKRLSFTGSVRVTCAAARSDRFFLSGCASHITMNLRLNFFFDNAMHSETNKNSSSKHVGNNLFQF